MQGQSTSTAVRSMGSRTRSGSAAVTSAIDARQRGQAPSKRTRKAGCSRPLARLRSQNAGDESEVGRNHDEPELRESPGATKAIPRCSATAQAIIIGRSSRFHISTG